jgi:drug/metabolite transporter (DMT)-like permease
VDTRHKHVFGPVPDMIAASLLWIPFTILAAAGQTARNAMQRELTAKLGTVGATHVRFLFGFPFAVIFLAGVLVVTGLPLPKVPAVFWPWVFLGAGAQIVATATMLATMNDRSFVVTIAYIKTEAIQAAVFGLIFLGDRVTPGMAIAIVVATAGVVAMSLKGKGAMEGGYKPVALGLFSGAMFALSAIGYRGAILSLGLPSFVLAATFTVTVGLLLQAGCLTLYLAVRDHAVLTAIMRAWRPSLFAGLMGATASEFWFLAFAITSVANVRTLALVEVLFAQAISYFIFKQATTQREALGMSLIVVGCVLLIWSQ